MAKYNHLTEKDLQDGKDIMEVFETFDDQSKTIALVYMGALRDRQMLDKDKQPA